MNYPHLSAFVWGAQQSNFINCAFVMIQISIFKITPSSIYFLIIIRILFFCTNTTCVLISIMSRTKRKVNDMAISKKTRGCQLPIQKHPPIGNERIARCSLVRSISLVTVKPSGMCKSCCDMKPATAASMIADNQLWYLLDDGAPKGVPLVVTIGTVCQIPSEIWYLLSIPIEYCKSFV